MTKYKNMTCLSLINMGGKVGRVEIFNPSVLVQLA